MASVVASEISGEGEAMGDSALELQESGWEELRKEARKIEADLDVKLSSYAKLGARFTSSSGWLWMIFFVFRVAFGPDLMWIYLFNLLCGIIW